MIELLAVVVVIFEVEIVVDFVVVIELAILKQIYVNIYSKSIVCTIQNIYQNYFDYTD